MDFSFNEEQRLLKESVERFLDTEYPVEFRRKVTSGTDGFSREIWSTFAELGLLGICVPEAFDGIGGSLVEASVVMAAIGRSLSVEPYLNTALIAARLISLGGTQAQQGDWLSQLGSGKMLFSLAYVERQARFNLSNVETRAEAIDGGYLLNGHKSVVLNADAADKIIVLARSSGSSAERAGLSLLVVDRNAEGVTIQPYPMVDGLRGAEVGFENVSVAAGDLLGEADGAFDVFERVIDEATVAVCAEAVGIMETMHRMTLDYVKERQQFGRPLSNFQVLQHRLVDMMIACELAHSLTYRAALAVDTEDPVARRKAVSAAKIQVGKAARLVGQDSIQLHGGMGMTDEMAIGLYFKRLTTISTLFGDINHHRARFAAPD